MRLDLRIVKVKVNIEDYIIVTFDAPLSLVRFLYNRNSHFGDRECFASSALIQVSQQLEQENLGGGEGGF